MLAGASGAGEDADYSEVRIVTVYSGYSYCDWYAIVIGTGS